MSNCKGCKNNFEAIETAISEILETQNTLRNATETNANVTLANLERLRKLQDDVFAINVWTGFFMAVVVAAFVMWAI